MIRKFSVASLDRVVFCYFEYKGDNGRNDPLRLSQNNYIIERPPSVLRTPSDRELRRLGYRCFSLTKEEG